MPKLFTQSVGHGAPLVMLHGWGMHSDVFDDLVRRLRDCFEVITIDLPGHGRSAPLEAADTVDAVLANWLPAILAVAPDRACWVGWSLGGQLAARIAVDYPERVDRLVLMCSNPCFVHADGWPHGMDPVYFEAFADSVHNDYRATLRRFISLQTRGSEYSREDLKRLRASLFAHGEPDAASLEQGLALLRGLDLSADLKKIRASTLVMLGERDTLVPAQVGVEMARRLSECRLCVLPGAGHAPFLSDAGHVADALVGFAGGR